ncbi:MAG: hypothetical protein PHD43_09045 [Methylococcales bacterium]|nr:hypothetical protein [Methylococcales bacterium]
MDTMRENEEREQRLVVKDEQLRALEDQNQYLLQEKEKLASDLNQKTMTLDELNSRLNELIVENSRIKAATVAEKKNKAMAVRNLERYSKEVKSLSGDKDLSISEKEKRIKQLKQQIIENLQQ